MSTTTPHTQTAYKDTPIGKIPADWEVTEFENLAELSKSKYNPNSMQNYPCIELENIEQETGVINGYFNSIEQKSIKNKFNTGQILFGKLRPYLKKYWLAEFEGVCSSEIWVLSPKNEYILNEYLYRLVQSEKFIQIANVSSGSKMPRADWEYISNYPFPLPPLPEQKRIAEVLSTWDKAIQLTEQLIRQKEQRKKWLMQQLLTGKKRLFSSDDLGDISYELQKVKLGDLIKLASGDTKPNDTNQFFTSTYAFPVYGGNGIMCYSKEFNSSDERIIIGRVGEYCGVTRIVFQKCWITDNALYTNKIDDSVSILYLFYKLQFEDLSKLRSVAGQPLVSQKPIYNLSLLIHRSKHEQTAIAEVLQTADKEIELLKAKAKQLKEQKKGLMQQLLTGKKRLNLNLQD